MARQTKAEREQQALIEKEQRIAEYTKNYPAELMRAFEDVCTHSPGSTIEVVDGQFVVQSPIAHSKHLPSTWKLPYQITGTEWFEVLEDLKSYIDIERENRKQYKVRQSKIECAMSKLTSEEIVLLGLI
jgi:hypothetical protein